MAQILDGKVAFDHYKTEIKARIDKAVAAGYRPPHLVAVIVGHDGASETYVASKERNSKALGMTSEIIRLPADCTQEKLMQTVEKLNKMEHVDGYIVQLPLPKHLDAGPVIQAMNYHKDVDGFHPVNTGKMLKGQPCMLPATPMGILLLLEYYKIPTMGKHAVVVGRSDIVGKPMAALLARNDYPGNCTVTLCHSRTENLSKYTLDADILVVASGIPEMIHGEMIKPGAVVVDVGISRLEDHENQKGYVIKGDVHYASASQVASAITPVPGGVGLMTICGLMMNTLLAYEENYIHNHPAF